MYRLKEQSFETQINSEAQAVCLVPNLHSMQPHAHANESAMETAPLQTSPNIQVLFPGLWLRIVKLLTPFHI